MKYLTDIQSAASDPDKMELLYQQSCEQSTEQEFRTDLYTALENSPDSILLATWKSRFEHNPLPAVKRTTHWGLAIILGVITGLILWGISNPDWIFLDQVPFFAVVWAPLATLPALIFLSITSHKNYLNAAVAAIALILLTGYILLLAPGQSRLAGFDYLVLMLVQLPLLCWIGMGVAVLGFKSRAGNRFSFLIKSIEVMIAAGVFLSFGLAFGAITFGLFEALNVTLPQFIMRLIMFGGFGLIPLLAIAAMYDPKASPEEQDFSQGLSKFIFTIMRLLLPLTLVVLFVYIFVIPFNFFAPFHNRNLLIIYNVMQFAILGLLIGATPIRMDDLSSRFQLWLRRGMLAVASLALLISAYALSAVLYRTALDHLTINRTAIIGWNVINIVVLVVLIVTQLRKSATAWHERMQLVFSRATTAYLVWSVILIIALPLIFR